MRKIVILSIFITLIAGAASGQMSIGAGFLYDYNANNGIKSEPLDMKFGRNNTSFGGFVFFDISFVELNINYSYGTLKPYIKGNTITIDPPEELKMSQLGLSIYAKYKLNLGKISLFPMAGVEYNIALAVRDAHGNDLYANSATKKAFRDYSQFGLLGGVGLDIPFTPKIFLRAEALFHFRFPSKDARAIAETRDDYNITYGVGPRLKLGIGYRL